MGEVAIAARVYLGGYWDYHVRPVAGGDLIKVHAPPSNTLEVGQHVTLSVDPAGVAVVG